MFGYIKGIIAEIYKDHIIVDNQGIGYSVFVANPYEFKVDEEVLVYVYQIIREDAHLLFGFRNKEEKSLFLSLLSVKGIGPKSALGVVAASTVTGIVDAIDSGDTNYLKKIPGIGPKAAQQIIFDLKGKLSAPIVTNSDMNEAVEVLLALGYKNSEIRTAMAKLGFRKADTNTYVKEALKLLVK